jgi:leader peptidase (prepilin peptidase)/N-methyltransferase
MIGTYFTVLAALAGLAFGSFLNTCASRWPEEESAVKPRSHCRSCDHTLAWWENIPLGSWLFLRGRCRNCKSPIPWRYPLVELAVGTLWASAVARVFSSAPELNYGTVSYHAWIALADGIAALIFLWLLVALAVLDAENLWLPDRLIWPGIGLGLLLGVTRETDTAWFQSGGTLRSWGQLAGRAALVWFAGVLIPAAVLLLIRFLYQWLRGKEGLGMGDVKLMAMIGGWLGIPAALLSFAFAAVIGALSALVLLAMARSRKEREEWGMKKLPLGTFICLGAMVSTFWGQPIIDAYRHWAGI